MSKYPFFRKIRLTLELKTEYKIEKYNNCEMLYGKGMGERKRKREKKNRKKLHRQGGIS